jgi:diguanylate cyclase (GGDEF)-like protein
VSPAPPKVVPTWRPRKRIFAERAKFLKAIPMMQGVSLQAIGALAETAAEETFRASSTVLADAAKSQKVYVVKAGEVNVVKRGEAGMSRLAKLAVGEIFGSTVAANPFEEGAVIRSGPQALVLYSWDPDEFAEIVAPYLQVIRERRALAQGEKAKIHDRLVSYAKAMTDANDKLKQLATTDSLTGLLNHGAILQRLEQEHGRHSTSVEPFSVLMVDIDHFKRCNDTFGHAAGDAALRETAQLLHDLLRPTDAVGRYGGEEFLVVLAETGPAGAATVAERARSAVERLEIYHGGQVIPVTISIGAATWMPSAPNVPRVLVDAADRALYMAKEGGRNKVIVAGESEYAAAAAA